MSPSSRGPTSFALDPFVLGWLRAPHEDGEGGFDQPLARWLLGVMARDRLLRVGPVWVDAAVLEARFRCVPARCPPTRGKARGRLRSCCADLALPLTRAERGRLQEVSPRLARRLEREPRLRDLLRGTPSSRRFFLDEGGVLLRSVGGRCVFSRIDGRGRIRCHLHGLARSMGVPVHALRPVSCELFPLVLVRSGREVVLTAIDRTNHRLWGTLHPNRYPCLGDPAHPPLVRSMAATLDRLLGAGFASALRRRARERSFA